MKNIKLANLKERDLFYFGERVEPYFVTWITISGMQDIKRSIKLFDVKSVVRWLQVNDYLYQFVSDLSDIEKEITKKLKHESGRYVDHLIKDCLKSGEKLQKQSIYFGQTAKDLIAREEMAEEILEYTKAATQYTVYYQITFFERSIMRLAQKIVKRYAKSEQATRQLLDLITVADRLTAVEYEQDDFLRLAISNQKEKDALAEKHAKKYGWLSIRYFLGESWTKNDVLARLNGVDEAYAKSELAARLSHRQERESLISEATRKFSIKDKKIVRQIRQLVFLRTQRGDFFHESAYHVRPLLDKIAVELSVEYADLLHLSGEEVALALKGEIDYLERVTKRKKSFLIYHD